MLYLGDALRQRGYLFHKLIWNSSIHQIMGRVTQHLITDVKDEERCQTCCQRVHDAETEESTNNTDQGRDGCDRILTVVLRRRQQGRTGEWLCRPTGIT